MGKIFVRTTAYNAEKTLNRCVDSVLSQTYRAEDIEFYLCDNGSTDSTGEIVHDYAARDSRFHVFSNQVNHVWEESCIPFRRITETLSDDDYLVFLDADDEYLPNFLETLLPFMEKNQLDIAIGGVELCSAGTERVLDRRVIDTPLLLDNGIARCELFPVYHWFMRAVWGKIYSGRVARALPTFATWPKFWNNLKYGTDTLMVFQALRHAARLGIYSEVIYRYFVSHKSVSFQYDPHRFDSDICLNNDALDFLSAYGPVSRQNREFLAAVYANAVNDTVHVLHNADISKEDKLREYHRIAEHPVTAENFTYNLSEVEHTRKELLAGALSCRSANNAMEEIPAILNALAPKCAAAFSMDSIPLLNTKPVLLEPLISDNSEATLKILLEMLRTNDQSKKFDLCSMVAALSTDKPLLRDCCNKKFLRRYGNIYLTVWRGQYGEALDAMAGLLLNGEKVDETFLQLYLSLAALQNLPETFVVGKIKLAEYYFQKTDLENCRSTLLELDEMGAGENPLVLQIKAELK